MAECFIFTHATEQLCTELLQSTDTGLIKEKLRQSNPEIPNHVAFEIVSFCRLRCWSKVQLAVLIGILAEVINFDSQSNLDTIDQSFQQLKSLVLRHSCERPPWTSGIFTPEEVTICLPKVAYTRTKLIHLISSGSTYRRFLYGTLLPAFHASQAVNRKKNSHS